MIWLNVYVTNKDPSLIAGYYVEALMELSGCPRLVKVDAGTENGVIKTLQDTLMGEARNGLHHTYIEGTSILNQRIESYWCYLRKQCLEYWISLFHDLKEHGNFVGDFVDQNILLFCFMAIVQVSE